MSESHHLISIGPDRIGAVKKDPASSEQRWIAHTMDGRSCRFALRREAIAWLESAWRDTPDERKHKSVTLASLT